MDRYVLIFCLCSIPFITTHPTIEGPPRKEVNSAETYEETGPPAPPPPGYDLDDEPVPPPPHTIGEEDVHLYEPPTALLTSEEIRARFAQEKVEEEKHGKTIDQIILENTKDLNNTKVREGDVRVAQRKRRSADEDFDYEYGGDDAAPEPEQLTEKEIHDMPPIDEVAADIIKQRSGDKSMDQILQVAFDKGDGKELQEREKPQASAFLMGQARGRSLAQDEIFDMDMLLTKEQKEELFKEPGNRKKRAALKTGLWKNGIIPYSFMSNAFTEQDKSQIFSAMNEWSERTCVKFEPYSSALATRLGHKNRIMIQDGNGCSSYVGMIRRGPQPVTLAPGCRVKSVILHELGHAIGLHHEQCRPDRDTFVTINENNVYPSMRYNFDKYSYNQIDTRQETYDYYSIMHYGKTAFSSNGRITIQPKARSMYDVIGNQRKLSDSDARVVRKMYNCGTTTTPTTTTTRPPITKCEDRGKYCKYWKEVGQCELNPGYMFRYCTMTCGKCKGDCEDANAYCPAWANAGYCSGKYESYMTRNCPKSCGKCGSAYADLKDLWGDSFIDDASNTTAIVVGVIAAILVVAIVVGVAIFLKKRSAQPQ